MQGSIQLFEGVNSYYLNFTFDSVNPLQKISDRRILQHTLTSCMSVVEPDARL